MSSPLRDRKEDLSLDRSAPIDPSERIPARRAQLEAALAQRFPGSFRLEERPAPPTVPTGIAPLDALCGGLPRGALTEIFGPASSGRTTLLVAALAALTRRGEACALVDASDNFDPAGATAAGVVLERLLWIRCGAENPPRRRGGTERIESISRKSKKGSSAPPRLRCEYKRLEQALKATDLLLQSGGFGLVAVDLAGIPPAAARRVPLTSWFRFRRAVENTPTVLLLLEEEPFARSCASLALRMHPPAAGFRAVSTAADVPAHARLLSQISMTAEVVRSPLARKPAASAAAFAAAAEWVRKAG